MTDERRLRARGLVPAVLAILFCLGVTSAGAAEPVAVASLETEASANPLGIDEPMPRLSWRLESDRRGVLQSSFRVLVATDPGLLSPGTADVWDSGEVETSRPFADYGGPPLASRTRYHWTVQVRDEKRDLAAFAEPAWFETAFLDPSEWRADWIGAPNPDGEGRETDCSDAPGKREDRRCTLPSPVLRKKFAVDAPIKRARLYASGLGYGIVHLNGARIGDAVLDPAFTDYEERVFYRTYDVTEALQGGANTIAVELGRGFYAVTDDGLGRYDTSAAEWHDEPKLRLELHVEHGDGSETTILTDSSWRVAEGPSIFDSFQLGETYDAGRDRDLGGWKEPGFDDSSWESAAVAAAPNGTLRAQSLEPIRVVGERGFETVTETAPGVFLFDLGQNLAGWAELTVEGPPGSEIRLRYGEKLDANERVVATDDLGAVNSPNSQSDLYRLAGGGVETWRPRFSYKGFRYVEVAGWPGTPAKDSLRAEILRTDAARHGEFESSNALLNKIFDNTLRAIGSNMFGIPTDTPLYEKTGWTGDAQLTAPTWNYLFDVQRLHRKWVGDVADTQDATGELFEWAPAATPGLTRAGVPAMNTGALFPGPTPGWDAALFVVPRELYRHYGDERAFRDHYEAMKLYFDWISTFGPVVLPGLGDWCPPAGCLFPGFAPFQDPDTERGARRALDAGAYYYFLEPLDSTAWSFFFAKTLAEAAELLGFEEDAARFHETAERIRATFNAVFFDPVQKVYEEAKGQPYEQHHNVMPLAFGIAPEKDAQAVADNLAADVVARGNHLDTGIVGTRYLFEALTGHGHLAEAFAVAMQTTFPSYGYWIETLGLTSLAEDWNGTFRSLNHHMFGTIVQWFFEDLAGMEPAAPGFGEIEIRPELPEGLDHVSASTDTVRGRVSSEWRREANGSLTIEVAVPPNAVATLYVPANHPGRVAETGLAFTKPAQDAEGVELVRVESDRVLYRIGSGSYVFRVDAPGT